jgi:dTDP-4-dehydrorhamnose reductase
MIDVLVTGANGQLAKSIALYANTVIGFNFVFKSKNELDITNAEELQSVFKANHFEYCINCAAYTNVEQSEKTPEIAYEINGNGVQKLAKTCRKFKTKLIHISTDYVFDGSSDIPYTEENIPNPLNVYGISKLKGESYIQEVMEAYYIIRVSWLYSMFEKNFFDTIYNYLQNKKSLSIVTSQRGTPTSCLNLAQYLLWILTSDLAFGIYHFSDDGEATWYDFAYEIAKQFNDSDYLNLVNPTETYPTLSERPGYSVMDNSKRKIKYNTAVHWKNAVKEVYKLRKKN